MGRDWYGPEAFEVFKRSQPFNAVGTGTLRPLHILQFLSNTGKHRLLNIVANTQVDLGGVNVDPEPPGRVVATVNQGVVAKSSVLARVESARPTQPGKAEVTLKPVFAFKQVFRYVDQDGAQQRLVVGDALNEIGPDVVEAVTYLLSAHKRDSANRWFASDYTDPVAGFVVTLGATSGNGLTLSGANFEFLTLRRAEYGRSQIY